MFNVGDKVVRKAEVHKYDVRYVPKYTTVVGIVEVAEPADSQVRWLGTTDAGGDNTWWIHNESLELYVPRKESEPLICADCGCVIEEGEEHMLSSGRVVCESCLDSYAWCDHCEEFVECEVIDVDGESVCEDCLQRYSPETYFQCSHCDEWHVTQGRYCDNRIQLWNGDYICEDCFDDNYHECGECGEIYPYDDLTYDEGEDEYYCANCNRRRHKKIHDYSYKPEPKPKTTTSDVFYNCDDIKELLFGVELEIDKGDDPESCAGEISEECEDVYCKHDGSLDEGVEIVTHPCTLEYHLTELGWDKIAETALDHDFKSHSARTCGLHVHVGRHQMGSNTDERKKVAAKLVMLFDRHWDNIVKFSRRKEEQLRWANKPHFEYGGNAEETINAALATRDDGRYQAVNLKNHATVEFRVFNGTLKVSTIYATLQFVNNVVKYAMSHTVEEVMASQWKDIVEVQEFPDLKAYLSERNIESEELEPAKFYEKYIPQVGDIVAPRGWEYFDDMLQYHQGEEFVYAGMNMGDPVIISINRPTMGFHTIHGALIGNYGFYVRTRHLKFVRRPELEERLAIFDKINKMMKPSALKRSDCLPDIPRLNNPMEYPRTLWDTVPSPDWDIPVADINNMWVSVTGNETTSNDLMF